MISPDSNKNKIIKWTANHLGSYLPKGFSKDSVNNAISDLCVQLTDGRFRELQCIIEINREKQTLCIRRWLDNILLEEFSLQSMSNVNCFHEIPQNKTLSNIVTFTTETKMKLSVAIEVHIFHLEDINHANTLATDVTEAIEASTVISKNPLKDIPMHRKISKSQSFHKDEDIFCKTERNLLLLNYCFDDIELFLQHLKDQEEAQLYFASNKNGSTDRLLEAKSKPSTKNAYMACIQKIKFSLNLLSKLDGKIRNPDSQQLSLLLMENLIKIGHSFSLNHDDKISKVKEPLLTELTLKMLHNSLSKHFINQLNNWGEFWIKPREKWIGYEEKYYPEFLNGYKVDLNNLVKDGIISPTIEHPHISLSNSGKNQLKNQIKNVIAEASHSTKGNVSTNLSVDEFCRRVLLKGGRLYKVINTFSATKDQELSVSVGDIIEVIDLRADRNWWLCGNRLGHRGYSPCTILEPFHYIDRSNKPDATGEDLSLSDSKPSSPNHSRNSRIGLVSPKLQKGSVSFEKSVQEIEQLLKETKVTKDDSSTAAFKNRLGRASFARPGPVVSKKHGQLTINQDSTNIDVQKWLEFKKFSPGDIDKLKEFSGRTLFLLSRDEMIRILGLDVAARLDSFVKVQKSMSCFGTLSKKELNDILLKRRNRVDFQESF